MSGAPLVAGALSVAITASALAVVHSQHRARELFVELQELERERAAFDTEWGRLELEQSTWATQGRIERLARERLDMRLPDVERAEFLVLP